MNQSNVTSSKPKGIIYGLEERPSFRETFFAALQHLLAVFVETQNISSDKHIVGK